MTIDTAVKNPTVTGQRKRAAKPRWYVASLRDYDTHLALSIKGDIVTPVCAHEPFRPLTSLARPADAE